MVPPRYCIRTRHQFIGRKFASSPSNCGKLMEDSTHLTTPSGPVDLDVKMEYVQKITTVSCLPLLVSFCFLQLRGPILKCCFKKKNFQSLRLPPTSPASHIHVQNVKHAELVGHILSHWVCPNKMGKQNKFDNPSCLILHVTHIKLGNQTTPPNLVVFGGVRFIITWLELFGAYTILRPTVRIQGLMVGSNASMST